MQVFQVGELAEFGGYWSGQLVAVQVQVGEVGELADFCGYWSGQPVVVEVGIVVVDFVTAQVEFGEVGELADFCGYRSDQLVVAQVQGCNSLAVDANTFPVGDRGGVSGSPGEESGGGGNG